MGYVIAINIFNRQKTRTFSNYSLITSTWEKYKGKFINKDGRVIDFLNNGVTTSEGQSYALLRAVWIDDKPTFDLVLQFTKNALKRPDDNLFGWRWGKRPDSTYGFISTGDINSASDADSDIALALILAGKRWGNHMYTDQAKAILSDIWTRETAVAHEKRYLIAGEWANEDEYLILNPSYFSPYAYRIFAKVDKKHPWKELIEPGYELLRNSGMSRLNNENGVGLPPDWVKIQKDSGELTAAGQETLNTHYSYDAIRTPWRIALDYQWNKNKESVDYLKTAYNILTSEYRNNDKLNSVYNHDGTSQDSNESPAMYATAIGFLMYSDPNLADKVYEEKILKLYSNNTNSFNEDLPYYDQNWLWFGVVLYNKYLTAFNI